MIFLHELLCEYFFRPVFLLYTHIYVWFAWCARSVFDVTICHNQWNCWFHTFYIFIFFSSSLIRMLLLKCALFPLFKPPTKESCEHFLSFMRISQPLSLFCFVWLRFRQRNTIFFLHTHIHIMWPKYDFFFLQITNNKQLTICLNCYDSKIVMLWMVIRWMKTCMVSNKSTAFH